MTNYGTISTSSSVQGGGSGEYISRRPWKIMFNFRSFNLPAGFHDAVGRVGSNAAYFRMNYAVVVLLILFFSLLFHPISLIVCVVMFAAWQFLYFLRDEPLVLFGKSVDDRVVLIVLSVVTIVLLFLTNATVNILVALLIAAVLVVVHAGLRKTDDLSVDEENSGLLTTGGSSSST